MSATVRKKTSGVFFAEKDTRRLFCLVAGLLLVTPQSPSRFEYAQVHMGMPVRVVLYAPTEAAALQAATSAFGRIAELDRAMSDYRPDSEINAVAGRAPAAVPVSPDVYRVVARAMEIARATDGAFDPTVAPLVALWRDARATGRLPSRAAVDEARALTGWRGVFLEASSSEGRQTIRLAARGMRLDLGGIAKGYILQEARDALRGQGIRAALVEAGGDIVAGDPPPGEAGWRVALGANSAPTKKTSGVFFDEKDTRRLFNAAFATSGPAAQFVELDGVRYSHVVDPRTGWALTSSVTAHVRHADAATADALATAATVMGTAGLGLLRARFPDAQIELR